MFSAHVTKEHALQEGDADAAYRAYLALGATKKEMFKRDVESYLKLAATDRVDIELAPVEWQSAGFWLTTCCQLAWGRSGWGTPIDLDLDRKDVDEMLHDLYTQIVDMPNEVDPRHPYDTEDQSDIIRGKGVVSDEHVKYGGKEYLAWPHLVTLDVEEAQKMILAHHGEGSFTFRATCTGAFATSAATLNQIVIHYDESTNRIVDPPKCTSWTSFQ